MGKPEYYHEADDENYEYLQKCKEDITENLKISKGGLYIGSHPTRNAVLIGYGSTKVIQRGFQMILNQPVLRKILLEEMDNMNDATKGN